MTMTPEFHRAVRHVIHDLKLDEGQGADLIAVGVQRGDCLAFLEDMIEGEAVTAEWLAMLVQWSVAIGVWLERERWQPTEGESMTDKQPVYLPRSQRPKTGIVETPCPTCRARSGEPCRRLDERGYTKPGSYHSARRKAARS